jgi:hypothetical protein
LPWHGARGPRQQAGVLSWVLRLLVAAGLAIDAEVHARLAAGYDANRHGPLSQGDLFRAEAVLSAVVAVLIVVALLRGSSVAGLVVAVIAFLVSASALGALLVSVYRDVGPVGPLPDMYEPFWFPDKSLAAVAEAIAAAASLVLVVVLLRRRRRRPPHALTPT